MNEHSAHRILAVASRWTSQLLPQLSYLSKTCVLIHHRKWRRDLVGQASLKPETLDSDCARSRRLMWQRFHAPNSNNNNHKNILTAKGGQSNIKSSRKFSPICGLI